MFDYSRIEQKWQRRWQKEKVYEPEISKKPAFYIQVAYPYPSGAMHIGHARTYTVVDIILRFKRMKGYNTLMPMGWHVSGAPVIAGVELLKKGDIKTIKTMTENFRIPEEDLHLLHTPEGFVDYFVNKASTGYKAGFKKLGLGIDWRRELTTIDKQYQKFIEWQYRKLYKKGAIIKGKYPVRFCPNDNMPVGDHDIKEGQGIGIVEYMLLKFKFGDRFLVAATLRPETVFGQTNLWVNPDVDYSVVRIDGEDWIVSRECCGKLKYIKKQVEEKGRISGKELLGKYCRAPGIKKDIIILPSSFCDTNIGTGIVTSVPSDAPIDWMALHDIQNDNGLCKKYNLDYDEIRKIGVIPIITTEKYGDMAALVVCNKMDIKSQFETEKLEDAKKIVYKEGFNFGVMNKNCGKYAGMRVEKAKELVKSDLIKENAADVFYELEGPVVCRCNAGCVVRLLEDQWFVKYSNPRWKEEAKYTLSKMNILPEIFRHQYEQVFDWLEDKPCTRSKGLGTRFPWDSTKVLEPLADSTIYMAYFTISHIIKTIDAKKLDDSVFDFVFFGKGDINSIARKTKIEKKKLSGMRVNFDYWYPLMFNASAIELIPNHMSFSIFQHAAIFPRSKRQKGTLNLGMLVIEGEKMSSSKGNVVLIDDIAKDIGTDFTRFFLMNFVELWQEANWKVKDVESGVNVLSSFVERIFALSKKVANAKKITLDSIDEWIINRFNARLKEATETMERFELRKFLQVMCFSLMADLRWYDRRKKDMDAKKMLAYRYVIENWVKVLSPFIPHICEEIWNTGLKNKGLVVNEKWPTAQKINAALDAKEGLIEATLDDIRSVLNLVKIKPKNIRLFVAEKWKYGLFKQLKKEKKIDMDVLKKVMVKNKEKETAEIVKALEKNPARIPLCLFTQKEELDILAQAKDFFEDELRLKVDVIPAEGVEGKAKNAMPGKPAILIE